MFFPHLLYATSSEFDKVTCIASFVPTFDLVEPQDYYEVVEDDRPELVALGNGTEFHFILIVDREWQYERKSHLSGKEALDLFIRSLPKGSKFSVISFGSS